MKLVNAVHIKFCTTKVSYPSAEGDYDNLEASIRATMN